MQLNIFSKVVRINLLSLCISLLPLTCMGYVQGDINSDNKIGLEESIYSLQVSAGAAIPLSGTTINVPADIPTIQQAIDAASNGDTISIAAGTYLEALTIDRKILTLAGADSGSTIIEGGVAHAIKIDHSPVVSLGNLTVQNSLKGIYANNNSRVLIENVVVKDCTDRGIQIDINSNAKISNSIIDNNGTDGIGVLRNSIVNITGSVTTKDNTRFGLQLFLGSSAYIYDSTFISSGNDDKGVFLIQNSSVYVSNSNVSLLTNKTEGLTALDSSSVRFSSDSTVKVEDSGKVGIELFGSSRLYSVGILAVLRSGQDGLVAAGTSDVSLEGDASIENSGATGFSVSRTSAAYVTAKLEVLNSVGTGISVQQGSSFFNKDTANITVKGTTGEGIGIGVWGNSILRASGGTFQVQNNNEAGVSVGKNSTLELRNFGTGLNANISNNLYGIALWETGYARVEGAVTVSSNTELGLVLKRESSGRILGITIENNGGRGVDLSDGASIDLSGSTIQGNSGGFGDIYVGFGARSTLNSNAVIGTPLICHETALSQGDVVCP